MGAGEIYTKWIFRTTRANQLIVKCKHNSIYNEKYYDSGRGQI